MYLYIYIYIHILHVYIYIYIYITKNIKLSTLCESSTDWTNLNRKCKNVYNIRIVAR